MRHSVDLEPISGTPLWCLAGRSYDGSRCGAGAVMIIFRATMLGRLGFLGRMWTPFISMAPAHNMDSPSQRLIIPRDFRRSYLISILAPRSTVESDTWRSG